MSATRTWLTPAAPAAIALVRVQGPAALLACLLARPLPESGRAGVGHLRSAAGELVEEAVAVRLAEDELELMVHGGPGMRAAVDACLAGHGVTPLEGPLHAGAWHRLAGAGSPAAVRWLLAHADAAPPFRAEFLSRAPVVLITGPANAGKSTLFNAWCGWPRALVSAEPGTTRDLVQAETPVGGWRLRLVDSAGLRVTADPLERAGQDLVAPARRWADAVLFLSPGGIEDDAIQPGDLVVRAKADLAETSQMRGGEAAPLLWSAHGLPGLGTHVLLATLGDAVLARLGLPRAGT